MAKLILNATTLNRTVIPNIDYAIDKLNFVTSKGSGLTIPNGFKYASSLRQIIEDNVNTRKNLISIKDWIIQSNNEVDKTIKEIENELNSIKNIEIKKRESAIK